MFHDPTLSKEEAAAQLKLNDEQMKRKEQIRAVTSYLKSQILGMPKSLTPQPADMSNLKEDAPEIPEDVILFYKTLFCGLILSKAENSPETIQRKANALTSDAVYNVSRGTVRPWKNVVLCLGLSAITGSKLDVQVLYRRSHCINYSEVKALETEFVFSAAKDDRESPHGI